MSRFITYPEQLRIIERRKKIKEGIWVAVVLGLMMLILAKVAGDAFDQGFERRCQVWGNPEVCLTK